MPDPWTLQSCLADSAVYVRYLRRRVLELELQAAQAQRSASEAAAAAAEISAGRAEDESKSRHVCPGTVYGMVWYVFSH